MSIYSVGQNNKNNLNLTALKAWYTLNVISLLHVQIKKHKMIFNRRALILNIFNGQNNFENRFPLVYGTIMLPKSDVYVSFIISKKSKPLMQNISKKPT